MLAAHAVARAAAPGALLLYRVGEFYEILFDDAERASRALGIQLTRRRQKDGDDIPMCGIPASSANGAINKLLAVGFKVAVSEQPSERSGERSLQLMTAATSVDPDVLIAGRPNNLTVVLAQEQSVGFAWIDISTGEAATCISSLEACGPAIARIAPSEILVARWPEKSAELAVAIRATGTKFADLDRPELSEGDVDALLANIYGDGFTEIFQGFSPVERAVFAALLEYVLATVGQLPARLPPPRRLATGDTMEIDMRTLRGLEVLDSPSGRPGALLSVLDRTVTPAGARMLVQQLSAPLTKPDVIRRRLAMVGFLVATPAVRGKCREELSSMPDIQRACGRLSIGRGGPRDLAIIRDGLACADSVARQLQGSLTLPGGLAIAARELSIASEGQCGELAAALRRALVPAPPISIKETDFIADGYAQPLDTARRRVMEIKAAVQDLQQRYIEQTGIRVLKVRSNSILGYHIEVSSSSASSLGGDFTLRQGLASTSRFGTAELDRVAAALATATDQAALVEQAIFTDLRSGILSVREPLARIARAAAAVDLVCSLAQAAAEGLWIEPELSDDACLDIDGGRHPVAESLLAAEARTFVPNDCKLDASTRLWLLTGPNMAGKSTFLRQVALIVLLAQIGSFVPAKRARIGIVDKLFSRIGASDDLAAGRSTFMVEMLETSAILNQVTPRSLVILDEVGRGTSTHDGLSIAQACMEYLHDSVGCRTLFATHFHELAGAAEGMERAACMAMDATPGSHEEMFAYRVVPGRAGQSYGIKVAAAAGMPPSVLVRAAELLARHQD